MNIVMPGKAAAFAARQREQAAKQREHLGVEARSWYRITNQADGSDEVEILLYDEIGGWWGYTADEFIAELREVTAPNIRIRINSPGGSVFEGIAIANALRSHPANVIVQVDSLAASIASVICMAGDRVEMAPNSMLMIHDASGLCIGNASDMAEMGQLLDLISNNIADAYAARAGGTREQWREAMRAESWYLPDDAVEAGLADEALAVPKAADPVEPEPAPDEEEPDMAQAWDLSLYGYAGPPKGGQKPEAPPAAASEQLAHLVATMADIIGGEAAAKLRAAFTPDAEPAPAEPETPTDPEPAVDAEPTAAVDEQPAEPEDVWADMVAHLTDDDAWSAVVSRLTSTTASSRAAAEA